MLLLLKKEVELCKLQQDIREQVGGLYFLFSLFFFSFFFGWMSIALNAVNVSWSCAHRSRTSEQPVCERAECVRKCGATIAGQDQRFAESAKSAWRKRGGWADIAAFATLEPFPGGLCILYVYCECMHEQGLSEVCKRKEVVSFTPCSTKLEVKHWVHVPK